ncbi:hypothetical protein TNCV_3653111 [Trichonephila clavipes]|nr:hypothetical protein TNCV_3653111 [Trichonephila clavipes]
MGSQEQFSSKIMLIRIQQELLKTFYVIFRLFHDRHAPPIFPCRARVESAKTADAIVSLCRLFRVGCSKFVSSSASRQHKVSNQLMWRACIAAGGGRTCY